jgi:hypothetical protein
MSKRVTEPTYQILAKHGLHEAAVFVLLQRDDIKELGIEPLAQVILVQNLVRSGQPTTQANGADGADNFGMNTRGK